MTRRSPSGSCAAASRVSRAVAKVALAIAGPLALGACGIDAPSPPEPAGEDASTHTAASPQGSDATPPVDRRDPRAYATPAGAVDRAARRGDSLELAAAYGHAFGNWSWRTYQRQYDRMLALAGGSLRGRLLAARPDRRMLRSLRRVRQTNEAEVVAVDVRADLVFVVLRERAGTAGRLDPNPSHAVYRAWVGPTKVGPRVLAWERLP